LFIVFEGLDGAGKTTQVELLLARLTAQGRSVLLVHEPGGTLLGERVRTLLKHEVATPITPEAELLLFSASRAQLVATVIQPALAEGKVVIADRFAASTVAYQGYGRGVDQAAIAAITGFATHGVSPDLTVLLDIDPGVSARRKGRSLVAPDGAAQFSLFERGAGGPDRFEDEPAAFAARVRQGYLRLANDAMAAGSDAWRVIDGAGSVEEVAARVWPAVEARLHGGNK